MSVDGKLLSILVCPLCHGELKYNKAAAELICFADGLAFPVRDDIPVMLIAEATTVDDAEHERLMGIVASAGIAQTFELDSSGS